MQSIDILPKTTICGQRFTRKQLKQIKGTIDSFPNLSLHELANTLCEHLSWTTPKGNNKVKSCLSLLHELEKHGIVTLPAKRKAAPPVRGRRAVLPMVRDQTLEATLEAISPIELEMVTTNEDKSLFKSLVDSHHYLGFKQAVGYHICYFIVSRKLGQKLGCLLFTASAARSLEKRDRWIGWGERQKQKLLHLILSNSRFLIFPWIKVPNLASKALALATKRIGDDWLRVHKYSPVLIETFVDQTCFVIPLLP